MDTSTSEEDPGTGDDTPSPLQIDVTTNDPDDGARDWLRSITTLLAQRSPEKDSSDRVQYAMDMMFIAACERVVRLMQSDLPHDQDAQYADRTTALQSGQ